MYQRPDDRRADIGGTMDAKVQKLGIKLGEPGLAALLANAGFDNPAKIRKAEDKDLRAIPGIGQASLDKIRGRLPRRG